MVADEFGDHLPVWFPAPIYDNGDQMPVSPDLLNSFRQWNLLRESVVESGNATAIAEHYRIGVQLASQLAAELNPDFLVEMLVAGDVGGWRRIEPITPE